MASAYPKWMHHKHHKSVLINAPEQEELLGDGWHESLAEAKGATTQHITMSEISPAASPASLTPAASNDDSRLKVLLEKAGAVHEEESVELLEMPEDDEAAAKPEEAAQPEEAAKPEEAAQPEQPAQEQPTRRNWRKR